MPKFDVAFLTLLFIDCDPGNSGFEEADSKRQTDGLFRVDVFCDNTD